MSEGNDGSIAATEHLPAMLAAKEHKDSHLEYDQKEEQVRSFSLSLLLPRPYSWLTNYTYMDKQAWILSRTLNLNKSSYFYYVFYCIVWPFNTQNSRILDISTTYSYSTAWFVHLSCVKVLVFETLSY